jgi:hypothetical protein
MDRAPEQDKEQAGPEDRRLSTIPSGQKMALLKKGSCDKQEDFRESCVAAVVLRERVVLEMTTGAAPAYWLDLEVPKVRGGWASFQRRKCPGLSYHRRHADHFAEVTLISRRQGSPSLIEQALSRVRSLHVMWFTCTEGRFGY